MTAWPAAVDDTPGWYGKLSSLGDFAQRRLPDHLLQTCDAWLSSAIRSSRAQLGERWLDTYLGAPLVRFAWAPGVIDAQWWFGLLMPSCDSVGRYFPLLMAHPRAQAPADQAALDHLERWLDHLADAAMQTLADVGEADDTVDTLEVALRQAPAWPDGADTELMERDAAGAHYQLRRDAALSRWVPLLAMEQLSRQLAGCSIWWHAMPSGVNDAVDVVRGLPDGNDFVMLLGETSRP